MGKVNTRKAQDLINFEVEMIINSPTGTRFPHERYDGLVEEFVDRLEKLLSDEIPKDADNQSSSKPQRKGYTSDFYYARTGSSCSQEDKHPRQVRNSNKI